MRTRLSWHGLCQDCIHISDMQASLQRSIGQVGCALDDDAKFTKRLYGIATSEKVIGSIPSQTWILWVGSQSLSKSRAFVVVVKRGSRVVQVKPKIGRASCRERV